MRYHCRLPLTFVSFLAAVLLSGSLAAQEANPPVAQPAVPDTNVPPVAPPASVPGTPPVALPVNPPLSPADTSTSTNTTHESPSTAPASSTPGLVITTPAVARFDNAMALFNAGHYAGAVTALSSFVVDFPHDRHREEALYRLAESYRNLGRADDALGAYTYQVQAYPDGPLRINGELRRGAILFDTGKVADAIVPLQMVADKGDGELQEAAKYLLGRAFLATQKEAEGRALLQVLAGAQPPGKFAGGAAQALAELDDSQSHFADALPLWQEALGLANDPAVAATLAARGGWSALQANQPAAAEKLFQAARQFDPSGDSRKMANTGLLRILFQQTRYTEWVALYTAEKDKLLDSAREETLYDLGSAQFKLKHWPEAVAGFDEFLKDYSASDAAVTAAYERFLAISQIDPKRIVSEADAYLKAWPRSSYRARVELLKAQELTAEQDFAAALPLWESLAQKRDDSSLPHLKIELELGRACDQLGKFEEATTAYQTYLDGLSNRPGDHSTERLHVEARLAVCLQKSNQLMAATQAWQAVQSLAPDGSPEQKMALESLGLIYARGGPDQEQMMVATFQKLLNQFPQSALRAVAAFSIGDSFFKSHDYAGAEQYLLDARDWDAKTWLQPATQRLVLGAYGMKNYDKAAAYLKEYDTLPIPSDPAAQREARLPAAFFYWLGETARQAGQWPDAEVYYTRVTKHPDPGNLLPGAWWQLGETQSHLRKWAHAVESYQQYRILKPEAQNATTVLLALGRAQLGAGTLDAAKVTSDQVLLQALEGPNNAVARMLAGEVAYAMRDYAGAAKMFATLSLLFDDPKITPQAMARAADSFEQAGEAGKAADWRQKLKAKYPQFQETSYL
ncbi:MAG TPA: tetratricopeptide repeat protein [Candidatus Methylacidiphilales bacterium]|nr:tetratricopeptide repeat protein [Candidatus Methylacidiphilales bacterium]